MSRITFKILETVQDIHAMSAKWDDLCSQNGKSIFSYSTWYKSLIYSKLASGQSIHPCIILMFRNGMLVGIAPMKITHNTISFLSNCEADYQDLIYQSNEDCKLLIEYLIQTFCGYTLKLESIPSRSYTAQALSALYPKQVSECDCCPYLPIDDSVIHRVDSSPNLKKKIKALSKVDCTHVTHLSKPEQIKEHLKTFKRYFSERWQSNPESAFFFDPFDDALIENLVENFGPQGKVLLSVLFLGKVPIAYYFGFLHERVYYFYRSAFNGVYSKFSPGTILLNELFKYCFESHTNVFDFMRGSYNYKFRYTQHAHYNIIAEVDLF